MDSNVLMSIHSHVNTIEIKDQTRWNNYNKYICQKSIDLDKDRKTQINFNVRIYLYTLFPYGKCPSSNTE